VSSQPHVKSGRLRALAVSSSKRFALMPDTPTVAEAGVPGFELTGWYGVYVPAGTPRPIVRRLHADIVQVLNQPDVRERLSGMGAELVANTPEQFAAFMQGEIAKWAKAVKLSGAKAE
jgi:tripartite-type tricarboxylate transporter receptor subunit TctC